MYRREGFLPRFFFAFKVQSPPSQDQGLQGPFRVVRVHADTADAIPVQHRHVAVVEVVDVEKGKGLPVLHPHLLDGAGLDDGGQVEHLGALGHGEVLAVGLQGVDLFGVAGGVKEVVQAAKQVGLIGEPWEASPPFCRSYQ